MSEARRDVRLTHFGDVMMDLDLFIEDLQRARQEILGDHELVHNLKLECGADVYISFMRKSYA